MVRAQGAKSTPRQKDLRLGTNWSPARHAAARERPADASGCSAGSQARDPTPETYNHRSEILSS
eukprot:11202450-Lingulodinium_polyedra.AAC.1